MIIAPRPEWVVQPSGKVQAKPAPEQENSEELPVRVLNADFQLRLEPDRQTIYTAIEMKFLTPQGLSSGNISLPWQADNDTLTVHSVRIRRGDEVIDVLEEGQTFSVLRREQSLEVATLDGVLTANMFPAGLEVGDTLELAYTITSSHPVLKGHAEAMVGGLNMPKDRAHVLIEWPEGAPMRLSQSAGLPEWKRSKRKGFEVAEFTLENVEPILPPRLAPLRYGIFGLVEASDYTSWSQVAELFVPLYQEASQIPAEGRLRDEVERIRAASEDPLKRAELALDLVQDKVRYVALAMGAGGLKPAAASDTWSRRFGDCKAKTALLLGLLREFGIDAELVAVTSVGGDAIPQRLPMVNIFDHVLVHATIDGRDYWLDGTRSGDGALADLAVPAFEWGLPIRKAGAELVRLMPAPLDEPEEDLAIRIDASAGLRLPAPVDIKLVTRGDTAISFNAAMSSLTGNVRKDALERYWRGRFDFVTPESVDAQLDKANGEFVLTLKGKAEMDWDYSRYEVDGMSVGYSADFSRNDGPGKDAPFANSYPYFSRTVETIILPPGFTEKQIDGKAIDETVAGIEYHREASLSGNVFTATRTLRSIASEFPASEAPAAEKRLKALADEALYLRIPATYRPSQAETDHRLTTFGDDAEGLRDRGIALLEMSRSKEALADFDKALEADQDDVWIWANRGIAQFWQNDMAGAEESFDRAEKLDATNQVLLRGRGMMARRNNDVAGAISWFRRATESDPTDSYVRYLLAYALYEDGRLEDALAETEQLIQRSPKYPAPYTLRPNLLLALNRREDAIRSVEGMVKALPDDAGTLEFAASFYDSIGERDKADEVLKSVAAGEQTPMALVALANRRTVEETDKKLAELDKALQIDPNFVPALLSRGNTLWMEYEFKRALADANKAIELSPTALPAYEIKAKVLADMNRRKEAAAAAEQAIKAQPDNPYAYMVATNIYQRLGMTAEALSVRERQQKVTPTTAKAYLDRSTLRDKNDTAGRRQDIEGALKLEPNNLSALIQKAALQSEAQEWADAGETLARARQLAARDPQVANLLGIALAKAGRDVEAEEAFKAARDLATTAPTLNNLCFVKVTRGVALERALDECNASLAIAPDTGATLDSRAMAYLRLGRLAEAQADFDRAIELMPAVPNSLYGRAIVRARSGDIKGAREDAAAALRRSPGIEKEFRTWGIEIPPVLNAK